jgi:hypothetical protein
MVDPIMDKLSKLRSGIVTVGNGRGFFVDAKREGAIVITAAHCLPSLPQPHPGTSGIYPNVLGLLYAKPTVTAQCIFADPVNDIAVLGAPDANEAWEDEENSADLAKAANLLSITAPSPMSGLAEMIQSPVTVYTLDGACAECLATICGRRLRIDKGAELIKPGMSGSPILLPDGSAIALVSLTAGGLASANFGMSPTIAPCLPGWLTRQMQIRRIRLNVPRQLRKLRKSLVDQAH